MKENAPEKIYLQPSVIEQLPYQNIVYTKRLADNSIEYTRTDSRWMPSAEQLNALRVAIGDEQGSDCCDILRSLLKDLKSL